MKVVENCNLKNYNTFQMDVECSLFVQFDTFDELIYLVNQYFKGEKYYVLGGGSNILFTQNYDGIILHPNNVGVKIVEENADYVILNVAAGVVWDDLVKFCVMNKYYGLENLTAIPGLVGSAPVQNIGAYGVEVKDYLLNVASFEINTKKRFVFSNSECKFSYRNSIFKNPDNKNLLITDVDFKLSKKEQYNISYRGLRDKIESEKLELSIENVSNIIREIRDSKLPDYKIIGNGGSFFKNPVVSGEKYFDLQGKYPDLVAFDTENGDKKLSAGQLIEKAGWKGKRRGDAGVYHKQALVLVNYGKATPHDILSLSDEIISDVNKMFGVVLEREINCV